MKYSEKTLQVIALLCNRFEVGFLEFIGANKSRRREYVRIRQWTMYFYFRHTKWTTNRIAEIFNKDHATCCHSVKTINNEIARYSESRELFEEIDQTIKQILNI